MKPCVKMCQDAIMKLLGLLSIWAVEEMAKESDKKDPETVSSLNHTKMGWI